MTGYSDSNTRCNISCHDWYLKSSAMLWTPSEALRTDWKTGVSEEGSGLAADQQLPAPVFQRAVICLSSLPETCWTLVNPAKRPESLTTKGWMERADKEQDIARGGINRLENVFWGRLSICLRSSFASELLLLWVTRQWSRCLPALGSQWVVVCCCGCLSNGHDIYQH